jgi:hypothetical protein
MDEVRIESQALATLLRVFFPDLKFAAKAAVSKEITKLIVKLVDEKALNFSVKTTYEFTKEELTAIKEIKRIIKETYHE